MKVHPMPASFKGQSGPTKAADFGTNLIVNREMPDDVAYAITKAIVENRDAIVAEHKAMSGFVAKDAWRPENVGIPLEEYTDLSRDDVREVASLKLSLVGLKGFEDYYPNQISGGMQKRAGLARAMALDPEVLFFDEPSAGLDPITSAELDALIDTRNARRGAGNLFVAHGDVVSRLKRMPPRPRSWTWYRTRRASALTGRIRMGTCARWNRRRSATGFTNRISGETSAPRARRVAGTESVGNLLFCGIPRTGWEPGAGGTQKILRVPRGAASGDSRPFFPPATAGAAALPSGAARWAGGHSS